MRYARTVIIQDDPPHPTKRRIAHATDVTRERIHNINLLDDGTAMLLLELSGNVDHLREIVENGTFLSYQLSKGDQSVMLFAHFEPCQQTVELLSLFREHEFMLNMPLEYTDRGGLRALIVGDEAVFREVLPKVPDGVALKLEQLGDYEPERERLYDQLTPRQQETLLAAVEAGYYQTPREATQEDVAERLGSSKGTIGEHLRKIEGTVLSAVAPR